MPQKRSLRLSVQYFLSYLLVMLLVMGMLLVFVYSSFYQFHSRILLDSYQNGLDRIRLANENALSDLMVVTSQIATAPEARPFSFRDEPEKAKPLIWEIERFLASSRTVHGVYLYYYGEDFLYSSTSSYTIENFATRAAVFELMTADEVIGYLNQTNALKVLPVQALGTYAFGVKDSSLRVVPILMPFAYKNVKNCGTIMYLINETTYNDWFASMVSADADADIYIVSDDQPIIGKAMSGVPFEVANQADGNTLRYEGQTYHVLRAKGENFSYDYLMLVSNQETQVAMSNSVKLLLVISALIAAAGALLSMRFVQSRIKPIRLLHSMISGSKPTGNELIEIRDSVQHIIDENKSMQSRMDNLETLERSDFARQFLLGSFESKDEYLSKAEKIHLNVDVLYFVIAILAKPGDSNYDMSPHKIQQLLQPPVDGVARMTAESNRMILILFADDGNDLMSFLESKLMGMRAVCPGITMAVSGVHTDYNEGQHAYLEAERAFEMRFFQGNSQILRFDAQQEAYDGLAGYNPQLIEELRMALRMRDAKHVNVALSDIASVMRSIHPSLFVFRCLYNDILNIISPEAQKIGAGEKLYDLFKLSQCLSPDDLDAMLHEVCTLIITDEKEHSDDAVSQAREIIAQRFFEPDLSISAVAEEVGLTDTKLSSEFRRVYQMTPMDYMVSVRMHQARHLLRTTNMLVRDIAIECGYYDISGFNRRFKAYTGFTPQQYRQNNSSSNQTDGEETP